MEEEAKFVVIIYALTALVVVCIPVIVVFMWWIRTLIQNNEEDREFTKLMIQLYEQEKQKAQKIDEGGFGAGKLQD